MKRQFFGLSDQGLVRSANQDSYYIDDPEGRFFIVADGMGGHAGGEEASRIATEAIQDYLCAHWSTQIEPTTFLRDMLLEANRHILDNQQAHPERSDMGTTIVVVIFPEADPPWCVHVGDSRLYRLREQQLEQITKDHTWISQAVGSGLLTPEQARVHPWRHVLAQCLGREELNQIDIQPLDVQQGDRLLLCSDGLTEELSDDLISPYLSKDYSCSQAAEALVEAAKEKGGQDNITVVIVEMDASVDDSPSDEG
ncbi:Serine/threonine phosphatase stp [Acaryochloris thomasi RCC1774]|uniref:Serine/threonine phosphatase stp n=1 Tax=Acaryochloris thomasi RCC1774 TaxID=1764569 RepID=A0A2W1JGU6_9CYAN|nr:Stp1/IreP family PP2C-type Ser/Thr phosphatase [Acaryochloris thomasi]PZD72810.1 Serine/threonine phosphatase stp [Acaryochloris thomasi RCC1774]